MRHYRARKLVMLVSTTFYISAFSVLMTFVLINWSPDQLPVVNGGQVTYNKTQKINTCISNTIGVPLSLVGPDCFQDSCRNITCDKLFARDAAAIYAAQNFQRDSLTDDQVYTLAADCKRLWQLGEYQMTPVRAADVDFPVAFTILLHVNAEQFERLFRAIYRPQNIYCVHFDTKSPKSFQSAVKAIVSCFDNVFLASRLHHVVYAGPSRLQADIDCMKDHLAQKVHWHYVINVPGQAYPLRTPEEMIDILRIYNGTNDIEGIHKRRYTDRYTYDVISVSRSSVGLSVDAAPETNHPRQAGYGRMDRRALWTEWFANGTSGIRKTSKRNLPPPHEIEIVRGSAYGIFSRKFVEFVINNQVAKDLLKWSQNTYSPDEHYWATLHHTLYNPHLRTPGGYSGIPETKGFMAVYVKWSVTRGTRCAGKYVRWVCVLGVGDLADLLPRREFFVNKFDIKFEPLAFECAEQWLRRRVRCPVKFDVAFYRSLSFVVDHYNWLSV